MHVTNDLIEKFFLKKCSQPEAQHVVAYLNNNPEVLDKYLSKSEWDQEIINDDKTALFWDEIWAEIKPSQTIIKRKTLFIKYAVAASVIAALVVFALSYLPKTPESKRQEYHARVSKHNVIQNNSKMVKKLTLADGSTVELQANAKIEYDEPFQRRRDISLEGEALFKVAKDKTKPFTVFSSHISTTALGTQFSVKSNPNSAQIVVHLYEGKVVVKSAVNKIAKKFYLYPGDELTYNKTTSTASIKHRMGNHKKEQNHLLVFDKEPLSDVFDQLANKYNVHIQYANNDFEHMYYIGTFDKTDSIQHILMNIVKLNGLTLSKSGDNEYVIEKKP